MGLLDSALDDPNTMGLLGAAGNMLQASGPSLMPHSFGQVLNAGLQGAQAGYTGTEQRLRTNQALMMQNLQLQQALRQGQMQQAIYQRVLDRMQNAQAGAPAPQPDATQQPTNGAATPTPAVSTTPVSGLDTSVMPDLPDSIKAQFASKGIDPTSPQAKQMLFAALAKKDPTAFANGVSDFANTSAPPAAASPAPASAPPSPQGPGNAFGLTDDALLGGMLAGPGELGKAIISANAPTDFTRMLRAAGIDENSPLGRQLTQAQIAKQNYVAPLDGRPGTIIRDPFNPGKVLGVNPKIPDGATPLFDGTGNVVGYTPTPGATAVMFGISQAQAGGKAAVTPIAGVDPSTGKPVFTNELQAAGGAAPGAGGGAQGTPAPVAPANPAGYNTSQEKLAGGAADRYNHALTQANDSPARVDVLNKIIDLSNSGVQTGKGVQFKNDLINYASNTPILSSIMSDKTKSDNAKFYEINKLLAQNALRAWQAAGGTGTDTQLDASMHANPNAEMPPQTIQYTAKFAKGGELALQGKTNAMQQFKDQNGGNVANLDQFERQWRNNFDPRLFQWKADPASQDAAIANVKANNPNDYATLMMKAQALKNMGGL